MLMAWPAFGITDKAAELMLCFMSKAGRRQGQSSSPLIINVSAP
jgi:hypothetical protein